MTNSAMFQSTRRGTGKPGRNSLKQGPAMARQACALLALTLCACGNQANLGDNLAQERDAASDAVSEAASVDAAEASTDVIDAPAECEEGFHLCATGCCAWQVDSVGEVGTLCSIALNSQGKPFISFYDVDKNLRLATLAQSTWASQSAGGATGQYNSLALDSAGQPHIAFYDDSADNLKLVSLVAGNWSTKIVDSEFEAGWFPALVIDKSNVAHLGYLNETSVHQMYARQTPTGWDVGTVDDEPAIGGGTWIVVDSKGAPHIGYMNGSSMGIRCAHPSQGQWTKETITTRALRPPAPASMAIDAADGLHIAYAHYPKDQELSGIELARSAPQGWTYARVEWGTLGFVAIATDASGREHLSYFDADSGAQKYAVQKGAGFSVHVLETGLLGDSTSLAVDSSGGPHICYFDGSHRLKYAH